MNGSKLSTHYIRGVVFAQHERTSIDFEEALCFYLCIKSRFIGHANGTRIRAKSVVVLLSGPWSLTSCCSCQATRLRVSTRFSAQHSSGNLEHTRWSKSQPCRILFLVNFSEPLHGTFARNFTPRLVFHPELPNCAFVGFCRGGVVSIMQGIEMQSRWAALVCSGRRRLPPKEEMEVR